MIFPTLNRRSRSDPEDALGRIERAINDRNHRLAAGISTTNRFDEVRGALVVSQGSGKYLRVRHVIRASTPIPKSVREGCLEVFCGRLRDRGEIAQLVYDLAEPQATVVEQLKCHAGKYVDRVLAVAVCDPGIWDHDFDGQISYASFCDATRLAEISGVTVIDAFPSRDLAVGGNGESLGALPLWVMFADRDPRVANQARWLVSMDDHCTTYFLPASDGLDSELPPIRTSGSPGIGFLAEWVDRCLPDPTGPRKLDQMYADGRHIPLLQQQWESVVSDFGQSPGKGVSGPRTSGGLPYDPRTEELWQRLADVAQVHLKNNPTGFSNVVRTGIGWIVGQCLDQLQLTEGLKSSEPARLLVSCPDPYEAGLIHQFTQMTADIAVDCIAVDRISAAGTTVRAIRETGIDQPALLPVVAALLGLFHIDQMPANIPWLTGAKCQRILGRLTPGRPSNWRQLVRVMADFQPAPMKLKDAI